MHLRTGGVLQSDSEFAAATLGQDVMTRPGLEKNPAVKRRHEHVTDHRALRWRVGEGNRAAQSFICSQTSPRRPVVVQRETTNLSSWSLCSSTLLPCTRWKDENGQESRKKIERVSIVPRLFCRHLTKRCILAAARVLVRTMCHDKRMGTEILQYKFHFEE